MRSFWAKVDELEAWHASIVDKPWLQPLKPTKFLVVLIILGTLIAAGMNWYVRHWQYQLWEQNPEIFYLDDGSPLFTTTDAPYFLGVAKAIKNGDTLSDFRKNRLYPNNQARVLGKKLPESSLFDTPLLSILISALSTGNSQKELLVTGNTLIPITSIITTLMVVFAFGAAGYWLEGGIAAAGAGLSFSYITRSGAGRIDTDQLNMGFFYLLIGLVIFTARARTRVWAYGLACVAGATYLVFDWWYSKPFFGWALLIGLVWLSFAVQRNIKRVLGQAILFVAVSGLWAQGFGIGAQNAYLVENFAVQGFVFPNTLDTITEVKKVDFAEILSRISGSVWLGGISTLGLIFWGLRHPVIAIVFGPVVAFALLNFLIGNRAIFYSAPMLWFGFAWLVITGFRYLAIRFDKNTYKYGSAVIALIISFSGVWFASPTKYLQSPTFDRKIIETFQRLPDFAVSNDIVIASWWDYGYMSMFVNGFPTLHDGGMQTTPVTYFIANSLLSRSQENTAARLNQLASNGSASVLNSLKRDGFDANGEKTADVLLVLTKDMANWLPSISKIGNWDIINGKPKELTGVPSNYQLIYEKLSCKAAGQAHKFICNNVVVDTKTGQFGNLAVLDGMVISRDGQQITGQKFNNSTTALMLHSEIGERSRSNMLIHRDLYFSVFHQLFHAGLHDERYFELVYDDYPNARVFKVR